MGKRWPQEINKKHALINKTCVYARNKQSTWNNKQNQAFGPQISHKTIHDKRMLGSKNQE